MENEQERVFAANWAFYEAFGAGEIEALESLWAKESPVTVIHPGWPAVRGREAVVDSWRRILQGPEPPQIRCGAASVTVLGSAALVVCTEHLTDGVLVATNVFSLERGEWRVVHHQAGLVAAIEVGAESDSVH